MNNLFTRAFEAIGLGAVPGATEDANSKTSDQALHLSEQLHHVIHAKFFKRKVMSKAEYAVFKIVEDEVRLANRGCRVFAQTSLGEIIVSNDSRAFSCINSKRVDIVIVGPYGDAIAAVEYQGKGHYQGTAAVRDAVKREALRKAGIHFVEINVNDSAEITRLRIREIVGNIPKTGSFKPR